MHAACTQLDLLLEDAKVGKLTKRTVEAVKPPEVKMSSDRRRWRWLGDDEVPGFGVKVYGSGVRVFCLRYRTRKGRQRMLKLGTFGELTVQGARELARKEKSRVLEGEDPQGERQKERVAVAVGTVNDLMSRWLFDYAREKRTRWEADERRVDRRIRPTLGHLPIEDLGHAEVKNWHRDLGRSGRIEANRCVETLRAAWKWADQEGLLADGLRDPTKKYGGKHGFKYKERSRDRWLRLEETERLMVAVRAEKDPYVQAAVPLFLLTGLRKRELLSARWSDVDLERGEIRLPDTKSGEPQTRTLTSDAVEVLRGIPRMAESPFVFPSPQDPAKPRGDIKKPWERIRRAAHLEDVTLHDLRRTCGSYLAQAGVPLHTIGAILGHKDEVVTKLYARLARDDERKALEALAGKLRGVLGLSQEKETPEALPDQLRALLEAAEDDPDALVAGLRGLVNWDQAAEA